MVLAILGLAYALVVPTRPAAWRGGDVAGAARTLAQDLRAARSAAIAQRREVAVGFDPAKRAYAVDSQATALPSRDVERLTLKLAPGERGIRFFPDGSATGGRIELGHDRQSRAVNVDWLTGRVKVEG